MTKFLVELYIICHKMTNKDKKSIKGWATSKLLPKIFLTK